jgi:hypothetical protein
MKIVYTILFFIDTLLLIALAFLFLKLSDTGMSVATLVSVIAGIIVSILLLVYLLYRYIKLPTIRHED